MKEATFQPVCLFVSILIRLTKNSKILMNIWFIFGIFLNLRFVSKEQSSNTLQSQFYSMSKIERKIIFNFFVKLYIFNCNSITSLFRKMLYQNNFESLTTSNDRTAPDCNHLLSHAVLSDFLPKQLSSCVLRNLRW